MKTSIRNFLPAVVCSSLLILGNTSLANAIKLDMNAGLWDVGFTMSSQSGDVERAIAEAQQLLATLPPAQRKMVEDMMASQGVGLSGDATSVKVCMTKEQIERGALPQQDKNCTQKITELSKSKYRIAVTCPGSPPSSGDGVIELLDSKNFNGSFVMNTQVNGKPEAMTTTQTGKWLSADCGNIKPIDY